MRELNVEQLKQVSGSVALGLGDSSTSILIIGPGEFFLLADMSTRGTYMFEENGKVSFGDLSNGVSSFSPRSFSFEIENGQCTYYIPSSLLKITG